jgi:Niemann-Pick C1 protein
MLGRVLEEVGPSITITSLTNSIAFGIGTTVTTPAIRVSDQVILVCLQLFCLSATIAMVIDFIYELTLFGSLLSLTGRMQSVSE